MDVERALKVLSKGVLSFFRDNQCFTTGEFVDFITRDGRVSRSTAQRYLRDFVEDGIIRRVSRGKYCVSEELFQALNKPKSL